jgi:hypothetical protein
MRGDLATPCVGSRESAAGGVLAMPMGIAGVYSSPRHASRGAVGNDTTRTDQRRLA